MLQQIFLQQRCSLNNFLLNNYFWKLSKYLLICRFDLLFFIFYKIKTLFYFFIRRKINFFFIAEQEYGTLLYKLIKLKFQYSFLHIDCIPALLNKYSINLYKTNLMKMKPNSKIINKNLLFNNFFLILLLKKKYEFLIKEAWKLNIPILLLGTVFNKVLFQKITFFLNFSLISNYNLFFIVTFFILFLKEYKFLKNVV